MPIFSWFTKKSSEEDYEQILASLALSIQKRQTQLSEIRLRERRATLLFTTWAFSAWVLYVALWWTGMVGGGGRASRNVLWGVPVVLVPIIIVFTRRIVQLWYTRKGNAEEKTLKQLLVQQRNKIEEIKKKTNYYSTKNLLDRYDGSGVPGGKGSTASGAPNRSHSGPLQSQVQQGSTSAGSTASYQGPSSPQTPVRGGPNAQPSQLLTPTSAPLPAPRKQWYDKLADALLGDDTATSGPSPTSRYALICERCFSHNGLVKEEHWEDAQYLCPKCGHFNKSARSRKASLTLPTSSQSAVSLSSAPPPPSVLISDVPSASVALSPPQVTSQEIPSQAHQSSSLPSHGHESLSKSSLLSGSTVIVDRPDAEGYVVSEVENSPNDKAMRMDVDS